MKRRHDTALLKEALPVAEYCRRVGIELRKAGAEMRGTCPFCGVSAREPFSVNGPKWRCNVCELGGDVIRLVANFEHIEMVNAIARVAELAGIDASADNSEMEMRAREKARKRAQAQESAKRKAIGRVVPGWNELLRKDDDGIEYLKSRGVESAKGECRFSPRVVGRHGRVYVPLYNDGDMVNIIGRSTTGGPKSIKGRQGCPTLGTFGRIGDAELTTGPIIVVEGMFDWLSARVLVPSALVLGAHGAGRWPDVIKMTAKVAKERGLLLVPHLTDMNRIGAKKVAEAIVEARRAGVTQIQRFDLAEGDLNDFLLAGGTGAQLMAAPVLPHEPLPMAASYPLTDMGNAARFADLHHDNFRYLTDTGEWIGWDGKSWAPASKEVHLMRATRSVIADIATRTNNNRSAAWAFKSQDAGKLSAMINLARSSERLGAAFADLDRDNFLLSVANGTIDLRTGELLPHRRDDLITVRSPVVYDPDATCPRWDRFIAEVFEPVPDAAVFVQRFAGYSLTGDTSAQCLLFAHGGGENGKGVLFNMIGQLLGKQLSGPMAMELFVDRQVKKVNPEYAIASAADKRTVFVSESKKGDRIDGQMVKMLTGQDALDARHPHGRPFSYEPKFKLWMASNWLPAIDADDHALWRRFRVVPFQVTFSGERRDSNLKHTLMGELPGILAWAVRGCLAWLADGGGIRGLGDSVSINKATAAHRSYGDDVGQFLSEHCHVPVPDGYPAARCAGVYQRYQQWARSQGLEAKTAKELRAELAYRGIERFKKGTYHYRLALKGEAQ